MLLSVGCVPNKDKAIIQKETVVGLKLYIPVDEFYHQLDSLMQIENPKVKFSFIFDKKTGKGGKVPYIEFSKDLNEHFYGFIFPNQDGGIVTSVDIHFIDDLSDDSTTFNTLNNGVAHFWKKQQILSFAYMSLMNDLNTKYGNNYSEKESKDVVDTMFMSNEMTWTVDGLNISLIRKYLPITPDLKMPEEAHRLELVKIRYSLSNGFKKLHLDEIKKITSSNIYL
jgi:hypothetical protein